MSEQDVRRSQLEIEQAARLRPDELVVVGSSHFAFKTVAYAWQAGRHVVRSGENGADLALVDEMEIGFVSRRFTDVVLVAGDGGYSGHVSELGRVGVDVTVVSRPEALSRKLRMAAKQVIYLPSLGLKEAA